MDKQDDNTKSEHGTSAEADVMQRYTIEYVKGWVSEWEDELYESLQQCDETPRYLKGSDHFKHVWYAGCWLNAMLQHHGASEEEAHDIGFAHGQRSLFGDTYEWAVRYLNEYLSQEEVQDKPGRELAGEINTEHLAA